MSEEGQKGNNKVFYIGIGVVFVALFVILLLIFVPGGGGQPSVTAFGKRTVVCGPHFSPERVYGTISEVTTSGSGVVLYYADGYVLRVDGPFGGYVDHLGMLLLRNGRVIAWGPPDDKAGEFNPCTEDLSNDLNPAPAATRVPVVVTPVPTTTATTPTGEPTAPPVPVILPTPQ